VTISCKRRRMRKEAIARDHPDRHEDGRVGPVMMTCKGGREWFVPTGKGSFYETDSI
jgi:hypothetical protein